MLGSKMVGSPVGRLTLVASDDALIAILWGEDDTNRVPTGPLVAAPDHPLLNEAARQLEPICGAVDRLRAAARIRGTAFQQQVWTALLTIRSARRAPMPRSRGRSAAPRLPRGRRREWPQPDLDRRPLPPRDRIIGRV